MHHSIPAAHAEHDLDLIAGHAAGDLSDSERTIADALLTSCTSCAELRRDLAAIAATTRSLPAPSPSGRDFRLTEEQAASLRRGGLIKSLLRPFAAPRSAVRPMAMAFTSLGLAGLLVANILPALFGGAGALAPQAGAGAGQPAAAPGATAAPAAVASAGAAVPVAGEPAATDIRGRVEFGTAGQPTLLADTGGSTANEATTAPEVALGGGNAKATSEPYAADRQALRQVDRITEETSPMLIGSLLLLAIGLALFGLRFLARRAR